MNLNRLYVFHVLAEAGTLGRAGEVLGMTPSAVWHAVQRFYLDDVGGGKKLFVDRGGLTLTQAGEKVRTDTQWFYAEAKDVIDATAHIKKRKRKKRAKCKTA